MDGNPQISAVAQWMMGEVSSGKRLYQTRVAQHVRQHVDASLTSRNKNGNWALDKRINDAFRELSGDGVVWERSQQLWRLRKPSDKPGRMQK
ncbi:MAG: hypothetical protein JNK47_16845 [Mesorhizobium sp.]|nr:hypothetical protein [Mesorhizobium sp.]MBL8578893.1 hypothetical protein [Mesorhizobium sp.]